MAAGRLLCDTVSVSSRAYTYSNHVAWVLGKSLGLGLAKANAKAKTFMRCLGVLEDPRGQGQASRTTKLVTFTITALTFHSEKEKVTIISSSTCTSYTKYTSQ